MCSPFKTRAWFAAPPRASAWLLHPLSAVDAFDGTLFGLLDARFFIRQGGQRNERRERDLAQKESGRWLEAAPRAAELAGVGAACVTVVSDREGDIYEDF